MEVEVGKLCDIVCSDDFKCHWAKSDQRIRYMFPDGTSQTCVGAQVRCGCTFTMSLISNITYEHPTAVVLSFIFITTFVVYMILRCIVLRKCQVVCCGSGKSKPKTCSTCSLPTPRDVAISSAFNMNSGSSSSTSPSTNNSVLPGPSQHSIHFVYKDKPPTYSKVISEPETCRYEDLPPPSYSECLKHANNRSDAILHI